MRQLLLLLLSCALLPNSDCSVVDTAAAEGITEQPRAASKRSRSKKSQQTPTPDAEQQRKLNLSPSSADVAVSPHRPAPASSHVNSSAPPQLSPPDADRNEEPTFHLQPPGATMETSETSGLPNNRLVTLEQQRKRAAGINLRFPLQ
ncbi:MAG: hypothetical protein HQL60_03245 [Magnetococcales bacterium]|nr:hypothetical protein [Magnetococcales bacterium]